MNGYGYQRVITYPNGVPQGSIFSSIGKVIGGVAKTAVSFVTGGPIAAASTAVSQFIPRASPVLQSAPLALPGGGVQVRLPQFSAGSGGVQFAGGGFSVGGGGGGTCMTKDGRPRRVRRDGKCYKRPSMNPLNPRAARRAITRIKGARKILQAIEREMPHRKAAGPKRRSCGCK
jgi:hypothetical protein